ncbi:MAG: sulfatase-like hydrolase/transferase [Vicinamibacteria bacterium]|jgi:arylsulfatase A-like enzyme/Tfp pilus assembly protein PilF|nr:sulfatase-like hydrolase/transferase [Vicinamibacteria bacterium]
MSSRKTLQICAAVAVLAVGAFLVYRDARPGAPSSSEDARALIASRAPATPPNVLVVTLDTTRADRLGPYGYAHGVTPNLDRMAENAVVFENAIASVPLTFPSHTTIFTGQYPTRHGIRDNGGFFLDAKALTMAEILKEKGYATGAFIGAWVLESRWGLAQGFDRYSDDFDLSKYKVISLGTVQKTAEQVINDSIAWLDTVKAGKFFGWVHLYDPHTPYEPIEPYASQYPNQPYVAEIAYTDAQLGRLFDWMATHGLDKNTIVIVTADHGESLGDHGEATHAYFIYDSAMHVPLIIKTPWNDRGRVASMVSHADILPTLLDLLGLPASAEPVDGRSFALGIVNPSASVGGSAYSETYFPRYHFGWQHLRSLRTNEYTYIDAPQPELYDRKNDPRELNNIFKAFSARAEDLRLKIEELARADEGKTPERQALDPDTLQRLAALGYVGNVIDVDPDAVLPDPKVKLPLFQKMNRAKDLAQDDDVESAASLLKQVVTEDPNIIDAHLTLGNWLVKLKRPDEAIESFRRALSLKPDDDIALGNLARLFLSRGRKNDALDAVRVFETALSRNPKNPQAWFQLAILAMDMGDAVRAKHSFVRAAEENPKMGAAWIGQGALAFSASRLPEAEQMIRKGLELEPEVRGGRYNLARVLEARGRLAEAESLYRAEIYSFGDHGKARFNLAQLERQRGNLPGYLTELRLSTEKAPDFGASFFFLAREELNAGRLAVARDLAERGLKVDSVSEVAPLGHYVIADILSREGKQDKARAEAAKGKALEARRRRSLDVG